MTAVFSAWDDMKRAAQSVYRESGNIFRSIYMDIGVSYQQIMITGHLLPQADRTALNHEIAQEAYQPTAEDWRGYEQWRDERPQGHDPEPQDLEPEL